MRSNGGIMKKQKVIDHYGNKNQAAKALGVTSAAIGQWPEDLTEVIICRMVGYLVLKDEKVPGFMLNHTL